MATFLTLTDQDLKDLGINTLGARRKMLLVIEGCDKLLLSTGELNSYRWIVPCYILCYVDPFIRIIQIAWINFNKFTYVNSIPYMMHKS